ncbi:hypothetical protein HYX12_01250 [Candidatus Woesearchaeota archaeon]|nr:hypothetical protein [Candidatus Woesearchaeota archaeon]
MKLSPIIYEPGKVITNHYTVIGGNYPVEVVVGGDFGEYITIDKKSDSEFDMTISFPEQLFPPGTYKFTLSASEIPPENSDTGVGSLIGVSKTFIVEVYSYDKNIDVGLVAPSVNENSPLIFEIPIQSRTYSDITSLSADILIFDQQNQELGKVSTARTTLPALSSKTLTAEYDTNDLSPSNYWAKAVVYYDGQKKDANATFKIGNLDLKIMNYTLLMDTGFNNFQATVANKWGSELRNVYALLLVNKKEVLQTPSINLAPWEEGVVEGIVNMDASPGSYPAVLKVFYEGELKEVSFSLTVEEKKSEQELRTEIALSQKDRQIFFLGIGFGLSGLILAIILIFMVIKRGNIISTKESSKPENTINKKNKEVW